MIGFLKGFVNEYDFVEGQVLRCYEASDENQLETKMNETFDSLRGSTQDIFEAISATEKLSEILVNMLQKLSVDCMDLQKSVGKSITTDYPILLQSNRTALLELFTYNVKSHTILINSTISDILAQVDSGDYMAAGHDASNFMYYELYPSRNLDGQLESSINMQEFLIGFINGF
jgi:SUMO ligase MMS21 Smc5/6 complex component